MKPFFPLLLLLCACFFSNCSDDNFEPPVDKEGPEVLNLRWIDSPFYEKDIEGPISDGGNYTLSISDGFHIGFRIQDESLITSGEAYFLVNDDPDLVEYIFYPGTVFDYKEGSVGFVHRVPSISLGMGNFYDVQPGDTYHFYLSFEDELGNATNLNWTANLIE
ncbi:MAG: hypothetical protein P1U56_21130 [Saprospiraceae bacterium]|nr:hypothetical protein [Saprospiraceae bacterium]